MFFLEKRTTKRTRKGIAKSGIIKRVVKMV
jgi:hypothetical protein